MGHSKTLAAACALALALSGCASLRWSVQKALRDPGESIVDFPEVVWKEYDCETQRRPFFVMEENELVPPRVESGGDFNHRMVYVMCPSRPTEVVSGRLSTRIRFKGEAIVRHIEDDYEIKPGRWVVDALIELPAGAEPGVYAFEVEFRSKRLAFEKNLTFVVRRP